MSSAAENDNLWLAPRAHGPVRATVTLPGSKSLTNRYLVLAALAQEPSRLRAALRSRDTLLMAAGIAALGTGVSDVPTGAVFGDDWLITPGPLRGPAHIDAGLAGTVMRFLPPVAALAHGRIELDGDERARVRPMAAVLAALGELGVQIEHGPAGTLPLVIHGNGEVKGGDVTLDASASSQFVSGLLLAAPRFREGLTVRHVGAALPSQPHVSMTVEVLRDAGVIVDDSEHDVWRVEPGPISGFDVQVEPDLSNAAPFIAAAVITQGEVLIPGWPQNTTQAGDLMRDLLDSMGAEVRLDQEGLIVRGTGELYGLDADLRAAGELTPVVATLAALASTPSQLHGIGHLRGHETDRLAALTHEINALGGSVRETPDGLEITPAPLHGGVFATYDDHRMAMAGALLGLAVDGVQVENVGTTGKTLPQFVELWNRMLSTQELAG